MENEITKLMSAIGVYVAGIVGIGVLLLLLVIIRRGYMWLGAITVDKLKKVVKRKSLMDDLTRKSIKFVNDLVAQLNWALEADRCYILEFHNGEHFYSELPRWKLTQTYESCADGVASQGGSLKETDVSMIWYTVSAYFSRETDQLNSGVSLYKSETPYCTLKNKICAASKRVYLFEVEKMQNTYARASLERQGVKYMLHSPIVDEKNEILGVICVDYQEESALEKIINSEEFNVCALCRGSDQVALSWINLDKLKKKRNLNAAAKLSSVDNES
jgi:hypothetical protein